MGLIHRTHTDVVGLREPPKAHKLCRAGDSVKVVDDVIEFVCLLHFSQLERRADRHAHVENDAGAAQAAERGEEEVWLVVSGASDLGSVGQEQTDGLHVSREDSVIDARPVRSGSEHAGESLLGDRTKIDHGEPAGFEGGVEIPKGDAALSVNETFLEIDLGDDVRLVYPCLGNKSSGGKQGNDDKGIPGFQKPNGIRIGATNILQ